MKGMKWKKTKWWRHEPSEDGRQESWIDALWRDEIHLFSDDSMR